VYLLVFHAYINEIHGSRSKIPSKKSRPYIYYVKFLALLGAPYIYDISRLRVNIHTTAEALATEVVKYNFFICTNNAKLYQTYEATCIALSILFLQKTKTFYSNIENYCCIYLFLKVAYSVISYTK
jgi:hypothetical protein